jgi:hypothetical protein
MTHFVYVQAGAVKWNELGFGSCSQHEMLTGDQRFVDFDGLRLQCLNFVAFESYVSPCRPLMALHYLNLAVNLFEQTSI